MIKYQLRRTALLLRRRVKPVTDAIVGFVAVSVLSLVRRFDPDATAEFLGNLTRRIGPWMPENRIGRENLKAAFPEKTDTEINVILGQVWENMGRFAAEFAHLDKIWDLDPANPGAGRIELGAGTEERFAQLLDDGKGALIFAAHLGNWELPALAAPSYGLASAVLFRRPNIVAIDQAVQNMRSVNMGTLVPTTLDAPMRLAKALQEGIHVGMLVDQNFSRGVDVTFFGRNAKTNPLLARLARQIDCPIHGVRIVRLPNNRFRAELTEELQPARDASGAVDVQGTMQTITSVIEGWIREHPDQWLWLHRRWR